MSAYIGRITSPLRTAPETISATGYGFEDTESNQTNYRKFMKYLHVETGLGVALNLITTVIMCWLAWALLKPQGIVPQGWEIAVVQSAFFEISWGTIGKIIFLVIAAAFLCDACLQSTDGFARMQADFIYANVKRARQFHFRTLYYGFVVVFTILTSVTLPLAQPGDLLIIRGVIAFMAMGLFCPGLIYLNYVLVPKAFPSWVKPHPLNRFLMVVITATYIVIGLGYIYVQLTN